MRKVLIINSSVYLPGEGGYKRSMYLFDTMMKMGYDVTLLTGDFNHYSKQQRDVEKFRREYPEYSGIEILHKMPYKKNISFVRYISDIVFSRDAAKWTVNHIDDYDVIYTSMPDMGTINRISNACKKTKTPLIIDVRDLHPEALRVVLKNETLYKICTYPMKRSADKAYSCADELIAVSEEYLERGREVNPDTPNPTVVYIGATMKKFDGGVEKFSSEIEKNDNEIWVAYSGTIGASYDLDTIIFAVDRLASENKINVRLKIFGQGPDEPRLHQLVSDKNINNVDFMGFLEYEKMAAYLSKSDITVNCIKKKASQSIINKVADYFAAGKPMLNSCQNKEMQWLIDNFRTGINYEPNNADDFIDKFLLLYNDKSKAAEYGKNARNLAKEKFDRESSYKKIIEIIDTVKCKN